MKHDYATAKKSIKALRKLWPDYIEAAKAGSCDKYGFGWNTDDRFSLFACSVSLDNWTGYYGSSSCSTLGSVGNTDLFKTYFIKWLDNNTSKMLQEIADAIEKDSSVAKQARIAELQAELDHLQEVPCETLA